MNEIREQLDASLAVVSKAAEIDRIAMSLRAMSRYMDDHSGGVTNTGETLRKAAYLLREYRDSLEGAPCQK